MAGALQAQFLLPFTHQQPDVPRSEEVLCYYSADNLRGLWANWEFKMARRTVLHQQQLHLMVKVEFYKLLL